LGFGVAENVPGLVSAQRDVDGNGTGAQRQDADVADVPFGAVARPYGHVLLFGDSFTQQVGGPPPGRTAELLPRDDRVAIARPEVQGLGRSASGHLMAEQLDDGCAPAGVSRRCLRRRLRGHGIVENATCASGSVGALMVVGTLTITLQVPHSTSLKEKRQVVRSLTARLRQ